MKDKFLTETTIKPKGEERMSKTFLMLAAAGAFALCGCTTTECRETASAGKPAHPCTMEKGGAGHQCLKGKECRHDGKDGHQCKMGGKDKAGHQCKMDGKDKAGHQCKMDGKDAKGQAGHQCKMDGKDKAGHQHKMNKEAAAPAAPAAK